MPSVQGRSELRLDFHDGDLVGSTPFEVRAPGVRLLVGLGDPSQFAGYLNPNTLREKSRERLIRMGLFEEIPQAEGTEVFAVPRRRRGSRTARVDRTCVTRG